MCGVQMQPASRLRAQQMAVRRVAQLLKAVAAQREAEVAADAPAFGFHPSRAAAQAVFAWKDVRGMQRVERQLPARELRRQLAVRIVFMGAQPQPGNLLRRGGELTAQADARRRGRVGGLLYLNLQMHVALRVEPVAFMAEKGEPALGVPAVQHADLHRVR